VPVFTVPCLIFFTEVRLGNFKVLLSSVEYRVAQLEAMLKPQQLWDPAGYTACNYNTPTHWRIQASRTDIHLIKVPQAIDRALI